MYSLFFAATLAARPTHKCIDMEMKNCDKLEDSVKSQQSYGLCRPSHPESQGC